MLELNEDQQSEVTDFFLKRFDYLKSLRDAKDKQILEGIELYNRKDTVIEEREDYQQKIIVPYIYTIVQTMVARLIETFFGRQNYLRIFIEDENYSKIEQDLKKWVQAELDKIGLKSKARDFIEDGLIQGTVWLQAQPILKNGKLKKVDISILKWFDVWFDMKAKRTEDTDYIIRKIVPLYKIKQNDAIYFNIDEIEKTTPPDNIKEKQEYKYKNDITYYDPTKNNVTDEVEILEYYGIYELDGKLDYYIFSIANRSILVRAEKIDTMGMDRKINIFPIRPLRQANSLIGKNIPELVFDLQQKLDVVFSDTLQNFSLLVNLLFKYKRDTGIDLDELFAEGGNAIGYDENPTDINIFETKNVTGLGLQMMGQIIQLMQQVTGAVDYLMGTSAGRGITETASGIRQITEQAMFKFNMMAENIYKDLLDFINYIIILWVEYGKDKIIMKFPALSDFLNLTPEMLEESYIFDIGLNDLAMRRDVERAQFINATNIIAGLLQNVGGDMKLFLRQIMERLNMTNIDEILSNQNAGQMQMLQQLVQQQQGNAPAVKQSKATPEETANNENTPKQR